MVIVAAAKQASIIRLTAVDPPPIYSSNALAAGTIIGIIAESIPSAVDAPTVSTSLHTTIHMSVPASELVSSPSAVVAPQKSIYQTDPMALKLTMDASWTRRGAGVQWIQNCNWP